MKSGVWICALVPKLPFRNALHAKLTFRTTYNPPANNPARKADSRAAPRESTPTAFPNGAGEPVLSPASGLLSPLIASPRENRSPPRKKIPLPYPHRHNTFRQSPLRYPPGSRNFLYL